MEVQQSFGKFEGVMVEAAKLHVADRRQYE